MGQVDVSTAQGIRGRAILETLYSTGLRCSELANLGLWDIDAARGTVLVREGKGNKDRIVPIGESALYWVRRYRDEVRAGLVIVEREETLFLSAYSRGFKGNVLSALVGGYVDCAKLGKRGSCHVSRGNARNDATIGQLKTQTRITPLSVGHHDISKACQRGFILS